MNLRFVAATLGVAAAGALVSVSLAQNTDCHMRMPDNREVVLRPHLVAQPDGGQRVETCIEAAVRVSQEPPRATGGANPDL